MKRHNLHVAILMVNLAGMMMVSRLFAYTGLDGTLNFNASTFQYQEGGEFNAVATVYGNSPNLGGFATFCLETGQYISQPPSGPYTYTINTGAVPGDAGAYATDPNTSLPMDNISIGTAWLYSQFRAGTLTLDTGAGSYFDANRSANAGKLQNAIWYLEDEGGQNNGYVALAETILGKTEAQVKADSNGTYGVVALNLYNMQGGLAQNQLALAPGVFAVVPEPSAVMLIVCGGGALGLALRRKLC